MPLHIILYICNGDAFPAQQIPWPTRDIISVRILYHPVVLNCQFSLSVFVFLTVRQCYGNFCWKDGLILASYKNNSSGAELHSW